MILPSGLLHQLNFINRINTPKLPTISLKPILLSTRPPKMVGTNIDNNPLDPTFVQKRTSIDGNDKKNTPRTGVRRMSDFETIVYENRNVAPYVETSLTKPQNDCQGR